MNGKIVSQISSDIHIKSNPENENIAVFDRGERISDWRSMNKLEELEQFAKGYQMCKENNNDFGHITDLNDNDTVVIEKNDLGESFIAALSDGGVYFDHNWVEGALYVSYKDIKQILKNQNL